MELVKEPHRDATRPPAVDRGAELMVEPGPVSWDWEIRRREVADLRALQQEHTLVRDLTASPDGERIAAVVGGEDGTLAVWVNGELWPERFEKVQELAFAPDGRLTALVRLEDEWTLAVDGAPWEARFAYAWNTRFATKGGAIAVQVKQGMAYTVAVDGAAWEKTFPSCRDLALSADGKTVAALVQVADLPEADVAKFFAGTWSVAVNGAPWERAFVGVWGPTVSAGGRVAVSARLDRLDYTIAEDGAVWSGRWRCVWEPCYRGGASRLLAPVREGGAWTLAENGMPLWSGRYVQLWQARVSADGARVAAVVAPSFGRWTIACDDRAWAATFGDFVGPPVFSADGQHLAAPIKDEGRWGVVVDGAVRGESFAMLWDPVLHPAGELVLARARGAAGLTLAVNGQARGRTCDALWDPVFSSDGERVLLRTVEEGRYLREVLPARSLLG